MTFRVLGLAILLIALAASATAAKSGTLLPPSGPFGVGRIVFHWQDRSRAEVLSPRPTDKREVGVWLWFPTMPNDGKATLPYVDQLDALAKSLPKDQLALARSV